MFARTLNVAPPPWVILFVCVAHASCAPAAQTNTAREGTSSFAVTAQSGPSASNRAASGPKDGRVSGTAVSIEPEVIAPPLAATWPEQLPGSDALLAPTPAICRRVNTAPTRCDAQGDPMAALADALTLPAEKESDSWSRRRRRELHAAWPGVSPHTAWAEREEAETLARDQRLAKLQACSEFTPGFILQLRADLFEQCSREIARVDSEATRALPGEVQAVLYATDFAARIRRFIVQLGAKGTKLTRARVPSYIARELRPWLERRAAWLQAQAPAVDGFTQDSHARAIALWAQAEAWGALLNAPRLRTSHAARVIADDYELRTSLFEAVDALTLELRPSAASAFEAALHAIAVTGSTQPRNSERWLLSALRGVSARADAPDSVLLRALLPLLALPEQPTPRQRLWELLPAHYAASLVSAEDLNDAPSLASLVSQGLNPALRARLLDTVGADDVAPEYKARLLWALGQLRVRLGILTHERKQFEWADAHAQRYAELVHAAANRQQARAMDAASFAALTATLKSAPATARAWPTASGLDTSPLDRLMASQSLPPVTLGIAQANRAEFRFASASAPRDMAELGRQLRGAEGLLEHTPYECSVRHSLNAKQDLWGIDEGRRRTCPEGAASASSAQTPNRPRRYVLHCAPLSWQHQRLLEIEADSVCD